MSNDVTGYPPPYEPTQVASTNPYETTAPYGLPALPPPPPKRRQHIGLWIALVSMGCLITVLGAVLLVMLQAEGQSRVGAHPMPTVILSTMTLQPTPTPSLNANYTAMDIVNDFSATGMRTNCSVYPITIWSWSDDTYFVSVHAISSATCVDDSSCTGYCSPQDIGLWVYDSALTASQAYNDVLGDENTVGAAGPMGTPSEVLHGRCLLLGAGSQSIYAQIVTHYCI